MRVRLVRTDCRTENCYIATLRFTTVLNIKFYNVHNFQINDVGYIEAECSRKTLLAAEVCKLSRGGKKLFAITADSNS